MQWRANPFFGDKREILGALYKMLLFNNASGNQYFFEILRTSLTVQNSKNVVKNECLEKHLRMENSIIFERKEVYKVSCVKY